MKRERERECVRECVRACVRMCVCVRVFSILKSILYFSEKKEEEENPFISANVLDCSKKYE